MWVTYGVQAGDEVPNRVVAGSSGEQVGGYAGLRREYVEKGSKVLETKVKTCGKRTEHLAEIKQAARKMVGESLALLARAEGVTEELKETDPLRWTGLMNNLRHSAEELVLSDLIYA